MQMHRTSSHPHQTQRWQFENNCPNSERYCLAQMPASAANPALARDLHQKLADLQVRQLLG